MGCHLCGGVIASQRLVGPPGDRASDERAPGLGRSLWNRCGNGASWLTTPLCMKRLWGEPESVLSRLPCLSQDDGRDTPREAERHREIRRSATKSSCLSQQVLTVVKRPVQASRTTDLPTSAELRRPFVLARARRRFRYRRRSANSTLEGPQRARTVRPREDDDMRSGAVVRAEDDVPAGARAWTVAFK